MHIQCIACTSASVQLLDVLPLGFPVQPRPVLLAALEAHTYSMHKVCTFMNVCMHVLMGIYIHIVCNVTCKHIFVDMFI